MNGDPVVGIGILVVVVVRVVVVLPDIVLGVDVVFVDMLVHTDVGQAVLGLRAVVVGDRSERVEQIRVHLLCLDQVVPGLLLGFLRLSY